MNLDEAIEILTDWGIISKPQVDQDLLNAVLLGIEALKRIKLERPLSTFADVHLLPGETEAK